MGYHSADSGDQLYAFVSSLSAACAKLECFKYSHRQKWIVGSAMSGCTFLRRNLLNKIFTSSALICILRQARS